MTMPKLNMDQINHNELSFEEQTILNLIIKKDGTLKVSPNRQHQCMPMTADFNLPAYYEGTTKWSCQAARAMGKELDKLVDKIISYIPKEQWHGVKAWGRAFYGTF